MPGGNSYGGSENIALGDSNPLSSFWHDTFGKADDVHAPGPNYQITNYGGSPEAAAQNQQMLYQTGNQQEEFILGHGAQMYGREQEAAARNNALGYGQNAAGFGAEQQALSGIGNWVGQGPGPSLAEAQLRQQNEQNVANAMSAAASGRGAGSSAAAQQAALFGGIQAGQQTNMQAAQLRAQEQQAWRQQQLQAMGMQSDIGAQMAGQGAGYNQLAANQSQGANSTMLNAMGQGSQAQMGFYNLGQEQLSNEAQMRNQQYNTYMQAEEKAREANQQSTYQHQAGVGGLISAGAAALAFL